jgi:hypothetical protein
MHLNDTTHDPLIPPANNAKDLTGQRFGRLVVIYFAGRESNGALEWRCRCDCGNETVVRGTRLKSGSTQSCGCLSREVTIERSLRHGKSYTRIYRVWNSLVTRCTNPAHHDYPNYGGRGITVCEQWQHSFDTFFKDMGEPPTNKHTLDRRDNSLGYSPENCRWATPLEQQRNKRNSHFITYADETLTIAEWAARTGISPSMVYSRIYRGWSAERALTVPADPKRGGHR